MPPVMGVAAFLMAEFLQVPYSDIVLAALIPALLEPPPDVAPAAVVGPEIVDAAAVVVLVLEALMRGRHVGETGQERHVVA